MPGSFLTTDSTIQCMHGGTAILTTSNDSFFVDGAPVLLESDVSDVFGCPFTLPGGKYSPCKHIEWSAGASKVTVDGTKTLIESSVGKCISEEKATQGVAVISSTQGKGSGE